MSKDKTNPDTTAALMAWVGDPDDPALEIATREILDTTSAILRTPSKSRH
jgi:hypothetical protein